MYWIFMILESNLHMSFGVIMQMTEMYISLSNILNVQVETIFVAHSMGGLVVKQVISCFRGI